jgi:hypothetical protein
MDRDPNLRVFFQQSGFKANHALFVRRCHGITQSDKEHRKILGARALPKESTHTKEDPPQNYKEQESYSERALAPRRLSPHRKAPEGTRNTR